jgi:CheY-like chemotaxis protein
MADDDEDDRDATREAFSRHPLLADLRCVRDGRELLDFLHRRSAFADAPRPGLILLDLNMPRVDGREALRAIKGDPALRTIPVVVLTTSDHEEDVLASYDLGANSFVTKPTNFTEFVRTVGEIGHYWLHVVELPGHN